MQARCLFHVNQGASMKKFALLKTGIIGSVIAALCCFTPVLAIRNRMTLE